MKIGIIGTGQVGSTMAVCFKRAGYEIGSVYNRTLGRSQKLAEYLNVKTTADLAAVVEENDILFIAVADRAIGEIAQKIAELKVENKVFYHLCGSQSYEVLEPIIKAGGQCGSMHPLQTFPDWQTAVGKISGTYFAVDGTEEGVNKAKELVQAIGGIPFKVPADKRALYHASACMACNHFTALMASTVKLFASFGLDETTALKAIQPIVVATWENISNKGTAAALTGPIVRGDTLTIEKHIAALKQENLAAELALYSELGRYTTKLAEEKRNLSAGIAEEIMHKLNA